jgi:hypothetical protein
MVASAPRIDPRLLAALARLDRGGGSAAELNRKLGVVAEHLGLTRPSYEQVRVHLTLLRSKQLDPSLGEVLLDIAFRARPPTAVLDALAGTPLRPL